MVNIFFQEWAPLFPIIHRPTFLKLYTEYIADPESLKNPHSIAQLNLVFGIAALSAEVRHLTFPRTNQSLYFADRRLVEQAGRRKLRATMEGRH